MHLADAPPPTAGSRLDEQREAECARLRDRLRRGLHGAAAPWHDRHAGPLGELLGGDLVAEEAHHRGTWADEDHTQPRAQLGERGLLGDETPADPGRVGPRGAQRPLEPLEVDVGRVSALGAVAQRGSEVVHLVRLASEHRAAVGVGDERDRAKRGAVLAVQLAHGVDEAHGGFAAVDDGDALEVALHGPAHPATAWSGAICSAATGAGSSTVR